MRTARLLTAILTAWLTSTAVMAAKDYYKWTDDAGVTHYSARKPHGREAAVIKVTTGKRMAESTESANSKATPNSKEQSNPAKTNTAPPTPAATQTETTTESLKDPERCEVAQKNLQILLNNSKVRMRDENGEIHYISEEEKVQRIQEFQRAADESC
jgi:ABC-type uncharacterized transport system involved in gliding motility auxiliary subunit